MKRAIEYIRVLPERVPHLVAQGWILAGSSRFNAGLGHEVVMSRPTLLFTDLTPEQQFRLLAIAATHQAIDTEQLRVELGLPPKGDKP